MEQNINNTQTENRKEQEIDLLELVGKLWRKKKQICKDFVSGKSKILPKSLSERKSIE